MEKWKRFRLAWNNYSLATGVSEKSEAVQVESLVTVIGEEAREVFSTFSGWEYEGDKRKFDPSLPSSSYAANCARISRSNDTVSIIDLKNPVRVTINTAPCFTSWLNVVTSSQ